VTILCLSLFSDGLSTTTPTILFNLYCLATNPEAQDKVRQEILDVVGDERDITEEHINKMAYMKAFIKETFRVWPNGTEVRNLFQNCFLLQKLQVDSIFMNRYRDTQKSP
jgi:cytochrome P450